MVTRRSAAMCAQITFLSGGRMRPPRSKVEQLLENCATARAKVRMWEMRADKARQTGRKADADRCDDKVRDWVSRVRQIERIQSSDK